MLNTKLLLLLLTTLTAYNSASAMELRTLQNIISYLGGDSFMPNKTQMTPDELGQSRGECDYVFLDYVSHRYDRECALDDRNITHLLPKRSTGTTPKPPIMVKCLQQEPPANATWNGTLLMVQSVKDVVSLLKPIGNATKRHEEGSCVLIFFYTETSLGCSLVARYANRLPRLFPTLRVAAIDAYKFRSFNTEFGIVGLPSLLLFHQGRPIVKFYSDEGTYGTFVTRHTGIQRAELVGADEEKLTGPLPLKPVERTDYYLVLAWAFILLCMGNYFAKSRICKQIVEILQRNWRESEAQLEHS